METRLKTALESAIAEATSSDFQIEQDLSQGGGCINRALLLKGNQAEYFVKLNAASAVDMFEAEFGALEAIAATKTIRVPQPVKCGTAGGQAYLILESLSLGGRSEADWTQMGRLLARMHRCTTERHGWHRDNTIGSTPQLNPWTQDWAEFFREQRLRPQFEMATRNGFQFDQCERLLEQVDALLADHRPEPSLLHGDLWSGNAGFLDGGEPVIYDPATYYGDRETDLAFSEFFGGFPQAFYQAYEAEWPLAPGYAKRKTLYNLYHVLNHANLFGGGYASQATGMIRELL